MAEETISQELVELRPSEIALALEALITTRKAGMVVGKPGIGKSQVMAQVAAKMGADLIVTHPVVSDPTDAKGLPWIAQGSDHAEFMPFGQIYRALNAKGLTVVFVDDLGQAPDAVQASWMQPVLNHEIDGKRFPDHVVFMAATNRRRDKAGVKGVLEPVKGRFCILHMTVNADDFCQNLFDRHQEYGLTEQMAVDGAAFIQLVPDALDDFKPTGDITNSPTPRNWVEAFGFAQMDLPSHVKHGLIAGRVGAGYSAQFTGYINRLGLRPNLTAILTDPRNAMIPEEDQVLWAIAVGLGTKVDINNFGRVAIYAERLEKEQRGEYGALLLRDCLRKDARIADTKDYIKLVTGTEIGKLMTGRI